VARHVKEICFSVLISHGVDLRPPFRVYWSNGLTFLLTIEFGFFFDVIFFPPKKSRVESWQRRPTFLVPPLKFFSFSQFPPLETTFSRPSISPPFPPIKTYLVDPHWFRQPVDAFPPQQLVKLVTRVHTRELNSWTSSQTRRPTLPPL